MFLLRYFHKAKLFLLPVLMVVMMITFSIRVEAATLLAAADYINNETPLAVAVSHNVSFVIPPTGHVIAPSDYIRVILHNFTAVTAPTSGNGWTGVPTFSVVGNTALITGISAGPNDGISIGGIIATNPASNFTVTIEIANDASGTIVYDSASFTAETTESITTVSVTIAAPTSMLTLSGFTSPGALVSFYLDGNLAGTAVADSNGDYTKILSGLPPNTNYAVGINAVDTQGRFTETVTFNVLTLPFINLNLSNILLPTTISLTPQVVTQGELLAISGLAHPFSQLSLFFDGGSAILVQAGADGRWEYSVNASSFSPGIHTVNAREVAQGGYTSIFTQTLLFEVQVAPAVTITPTPSSISVTPTGTGGNQPPIIVIINPPENGTVTPGDNVEIRLEDDTGIDIDSLEIIIGDDVYTIDDDELLYSGNPDQYLILLPLPGDLPINQSTTIIVRVRDLEGKQSQLTQDFRMELTNISVTGDSTLEIIRAYLRSSKLSITIPFLTTGTALLAASLTFLLPFNSLFPFLSALVGIRIKQYGHVLEYATNKPIAFAFIWIVDQQNIFVRSAVSDKDGKYHIKLPKDGEYYLEIFATKYEHLHRMLLVEHQTPLITTFYLKLLGEKVPLMTRFKHVMYALKMRVANKFTFILTICISLSLIFLILVPSLLNLLILLFNLLMLLVHITLVRFATARTYDAE